MKKVLNLILVFSILLMSPVVVNASYNGGSNGVISGSGKCPSNASKLCHFNNALHITVRVSLVYFNENGSREQVGKSIVYTNNNFRGINDFYEFNVPGCSTCSQGYNAPGLKSYFYDNLDNFLTLLNRSNNFKLTKANYEAELGKFFTNYCSARGKNAENCSKAAPGVYGFRILIEPYISGLIKNTYYFMTLKEVAQAGGFTSGAKGMENYCQILHTTFDDVGISSANTKTGNVSIVANEKTGYGYNIIDFAVKPEDVAKKCDPKKDGVKVCCDREGITFEDQTNNNKNHLTEPISSEDLEKQCSKKNCNYKIDASVPKVCNGDNQGYIKDNVSWDCTFNSTNSSRSEVKAHYFTGFSNNYCAVYCKEEIDTSLPTGNNVIEAGRYLTIEEESIHGSLAVISPIKFTGKKVCRTTNAKGKSGGFINHDKFKKDFDNVENDIIKAWSNYLLVKNNSGSAKNISDAKLAYEKLVQKREDYIKQIKACSISTITYNFSPNLNFHIEEPIYGGTWKLKKDTDIQTNISYIKGGNSVDGSAQQTFATAPNDKIMKYTCNESGCAKTEEDFYPTTDWMEEKIDKKIVYKLPDNLYTYIAKDSGKSYSDVNEGNSDYIKATQSNIPVHYSTNPGNYKFSIEIENLGDDNKFNKFIVEKKKFFGEIVYSDDLKYECSYNVTCKNRIAVKDCEQYCSECEDECGKLPSCPGVNLLYRPISLYKGLSFLNKDGSTRKPGLNWSKESDYVEKYIEKNRDAESYDVYKLSPMYEITLTPKLMKEIRTYNREMNSKMLTIYDETGAVSTGIAGYADFISMKCDSNGENCKSSKIRDWGISGCGIKGFSTTNFNKCSSTISW